MLTIEVTDLEVLKLQGLGLFLNTIIREPIFPEWDVVYCSVPTSPGGGYRSALGRIVFKTKEMIQAVEAPDIVRNKVAFSALGFLDGEVSLNGKSILSNYFKMSYMI